MSGGAHILSIESLVKDYSRGVRANDGISLEVRPGEVFGLLGHNGAGKTTLLNQIVGIAKPTSGRVLVDGRDAVADPAAARRVCSMQPQAQAPLEGITPREAMELMARIRGATRSAARRRADELIDRLDIGAWATAKGERLSGGVRRLTAFAMCVAEPGRLAMLDEPTNDVDPVRRRMLWKEIRHLADDGCAVLLVTHNVVEAERVVDRLMILDQGRVLAQGTPSELRGERAGQLRLELTAVSPDHANQIAADAENADEPVVAGRRVMLRVAAEDSLRMLRWAQERQRKGHVEDISLNPVSLEDTYVRLVGADPTTAEVPDATRVP